MSKAKKQPPVHPGEILNEEFILPMGISQYRLAKDLGVPAPRISEIVLGRRGITADTALRLSIYLGTTPNFWMNLQSRYDLELERDQFEAQIRREVRPLASSA